MLKGLLISLSIIEAAILAAWGIITLMSMMR